MKATILGVTDEVSTCDCCGKSDLKRAVGLEMENGEVFYYGTTCAARALSMPSTDVRSKANSATRQREQAEREARERERNAQAAAELDAFERFVADAGGSHRDYRYGSFRDYRHAWLSFQVTAGKMTQSLVDRLLGAVR